MKDRAIRDTGTGQSRIDILLPSKERFNPANSGAISGVVCDLVTASHTPDRLRVLGVEVDRPFDGVKFCGLTPRHGWFLGTNIGLASAYLRQIRKDGKPDLVEVHSRCHVARYLKVKRPDLKVALYLHNDPRDMRGARTPAERRSLLKDMSAVICVSDYIKNCFLDSVGATADEASKVQTARNGAVRLHTKQTTKQKMVLIAGRMVPEKGILECAQALSHVLEDRKDWRVVIAGAKRFENSAPGSYEADVAQALAPLGERAEMTGFIPIEQVRELQAQAAIIACPSIWHDPMPKAVLEALAAGSALLTTRRGGIPEAAEGRAHIIDDTNTGAFVTALEKLVSDDEYRGQLQTLAWEDFPFTANAMAKAADAIRDIAISRH